MLILSSDQHSGFSRIVIWRGELPTSLRSLSREPGIESCPDGPVRAETHPFCSDSAESRLAMPPMGGEFSDSGSRHWPSIESCSLFKASRVALFFPSVFLTTAGSRKLSSLRGTLLEGRSEIMLFTRSPSLLEKRNGPA